MLLWVILRQPVKKLNSGAITGHTETACYASLLILVLLWETLRQPAKKSFNSSAIMGHIEKLIHPSEKYKCKLQMPEKLKHKLFMPSRTWMETDGWKDEQG